MSVNKVNSDGSTTLIAGATLWADSPIGTILPYGGATAPAGFLLCDGAEKNKADYPELYAVIGDAFGTASVNTKFVLPDLRNKTTFGAGSATGGLANVGDATVGSLPNITGSVNQYLATSQGNLYSPRTVNASGALDTSSIEGTVLRTITGDSGSVEKTGININASRSSSMYKSTSQVVPASVGVNYIIKAKQVALPADLESAVEDAVEDALDGIGTITKATTNIGTAVSCTSQSTTILTSISLDAGTYVLSASADHTSANAEAVISITEGSAINDEFKQFIPSVTAYSANTGNVTAILKLTATTTVRLVCWSAGNLNVTPHSLVATKVA